VKTALSILSQPPVLAAKAMLGWELVRVMPEGEIAICRIVETEAYHESEPGCHAYRGKTKRNAAMFMRAGHAYVYFIYGMYHCLNVSCGRDEEGAAVLIRAAEPMTPSGLRLSGPGLLCKSLHIDRSLNTCDMLAEESNLTLRKRELRKGVIVKATTRIGLPPEDSLQWRFVIAGSPFLSRRIIPA
jgi:DNA-3-methyladenine glycosylase